MHEHELAQALEDRVASMALGYSERFEFTAEAFYAQTGFFAPGKSVPVEMYQGAAHEQRRQEAWARWLKEQDAAFADALSAGAAALRAQAQGWQTTPWHLFDVRVSPTRRLARLL